MKGDFRDGAGACLVENGGDDILGRASSRVPATPFGTFVQMIKNASSSRHLSSARNYWCEPVVSTV